MRNESEFEKLGLNLASIKFEGPSKKHQARFPSYMLVACSQDWPVYTVITEIAWHNGNSSIFYGITVTKRNLWSFYLFKFLQLVEFLKTKSGPNMFFAS